MINVKQITVGLTKKVQLRDFEPAEPRVEFVADVEGLTPEQAEAAAKAMMVSVTRVVQEGFALPPAKEAAPAVDNLGALPAAEEKVQPAAEEKAQPAVDDMGLPPDEDAAPIQSGNNVVDIVPVKIELSDLQAAAAVAAAKITPAGVKKLISAHAKTLAEVPEDKYEELLAALKGAQ